MPVETDHTTAAETKPEVRIVTAVVVGTRPSVMLPFNEDELPRDLEEPPMFVPKAVRQAHVTVLSRGRRMPPLPFPE